VFPSTSITAYTRWSRRQFRCITQALRFFNKLAAHEDRFTEKEIEYFTREAKIPPHVRSQVPDDPAGGLKILFRRPSAHVRITVFDGGHEKKPKPPFDVESLESAISVSVTHWRMGENGWTFEPASGVIPGHIHNAKYLYEIYLANDLKSSGRDAPVP
jgi:hypothetical protein